MPDIYIDNEDEIFLETVRRHGMENPNLPKWTVLRIALAKSLSMRSEPDENLDAWMGRSKNYDLEQVTWKGQKDDETGPRDITDAVCALLSIYHNQNLFDDDETFRRLLQRHIRRGLQEMRSSWRPGHDFFDYLYHEFFADIPTSHKAARAFDFANALVSALREIGVRSKIDRQTQGPRITRYFLYLDNALDMEKLRRGLDKLCFLLGLSENTLTLKSTSTPRLAGLDVPRPRETWETVTMSDMQKWISNKTGEDHTLSVWPGVDILGRPYHFDLANTPHLLIGGTTGSGKSVCVHALLLSLLMQYNPDTLQLCLIDTKRVEFGYYKHLPHLFMEKVITNAGEADEILAGIIEEMEQRMALLERLKVTHLDEALKSGRAKLPRIVVFIEELADLIIQSETQVEQRLIRLAQLARAVGIHLVLSTQRPDAQTFSGLLRSNIPARIALTVQKSSESKIILDQTGAEKLLMDGDMLVKTEPGAEPQRIHGVHVKREDINAVIRTISKTSQVSS